MSGDWLFEFDFYPAPRRAVWVAHATLKSWGWLEGGRPDDALFRAGQNPLFLYLRSHFIGRRLGGIESGDDQTIVWNFGEGYRWDIRFRSPETLEWALQVPGKKPFTKELKLYPASLFFSAHGEPAAPETPAAIPGGAKRAAKQDRLLQNIQQDLVTAQDWITKYSSLCLELQSRPWLWHQAEDAVLDHEWHAQLGELQASGLLPKTRDARHLKSALDKLFHERTRQARKVKKATERLAEIEAKITGGMLAAPAPRQKPKFVVDRQKEKTHPGLRIEILPGIFGYLGRNGRENEVLFKWTRDRDFWFHVRGYSGTHLWILRSDLGLAKDETLPKAIAERGAKIALWNSKLKNSQSGPVDITEKRYLKKLKGEAGQLKITKSEVLFVTLEEGFEKTLKWG